MTSLPGVPLSVYNKYPTVSGAWQLSQSPALSRPNCFRWYQQCNNDNLCSLMSGEAARHTNFRCSIQFDAVGNQNHDLALRRRRLNLTTLFQRSSCLKQSSHDGCGHLCTWALLLRLRSVLPGRENQQNSGGDWTTRLCCDPTNRTPLADQKNGTFNKLLIWYS